MKDQILLVSETGEPQNLGWKSIGRIHRDDCWQNTGWVYGKDGKYAVFNEAGPDIEFLQFMDAKEVAIKLGFSPGSEAFSDLPKDIQKIFLLDHYAEREPTLFGQIDGFVDVQPDSVMSRDADGDDIWGGRTSELMYGASVRVLVREDTKPEDAIRVLHKIMEWLERDPASATTQVIAKYSRKQLDAGVMRFATFCEGHCRQCGKNLVDGEGIDYPNALGLRLCKGKCDKEWWGQKGKDYLEQHPEIYQPRNKAKLEREAA